METTATNAAASRPDPISRERVVEALKRLAAVRRDRLSELDRFGLLLDCQIVMGYAREAEAIDDGIWAFVHNNTRKVVIFELMHALSVKLKAS